MCTCSTDGPSVYTETLVRRARVEHRCFDCPRIIAPGESYVRCSGVWDRSGGSYVRCLDCVELAAAGVPCWSFGALVDEAEQAVAEGRWSDCVTAEEHGRIAGLLFRRRELGDEGPSARRRERLIAFRIEAEAERKRRLWLTSEVQS